MSLLSIMRNCARLCVTVNDINSITPSHTVSNTHFYEFIKMILKRHIVNATVPHNDIQSCTVYNIAKQ